VSHTQHNPAEQSKEDLDSSRSVLWPSLFVPSAFGLLLVLVLVLVLVQVLVLVLVLGQPHTSWSLCLLDITALTLPLQVLSQHTHLTPLHALTWPDLTAKK
jgi:hypothetical protein